MHAQFAKAVAKCDLMLGIDLLVVENDHLIFHKGIMDGIKFVLAKLLAQIDAPDFGAQMRCNLNDFDVMTHGGVSEFFRSLHCSRR